MKIVKPFYSKNERVLLQRFIKHEIVIVSRLMKYSDGFSLMPLFRQVVVLQVLLPRYHLLLQMLHQEFFPRLAQMR